jgi:hypothetical protein
VYSILFPKLRRGKSKKLKAVARALAGDRSDLVRETVTDTSGGAMSPEVWGQQEDADFFKGSGEAFKQAQTGAFICEVFETNWQSVQVYSICSLDLTIGMGGAVWRKIEPPEILAACLLLNVKRSDRPQVTFDIQEMSQAAEQFLNRPKG